MLKILFVDDEPNILEGLQRMLRSMRREWQMSFANGGAEALAMLAEKPFDVIVSDMKMPGMDGAQLLNEVRTRYPQTVRIILSGYSEKELIMKSIGAAHQYLAKPCDPELLIATVRKACARRSLLTDEKLRQLVSGLHRVPSLPTLYSDLLTELNTASPSIHQIGEIIRQDIGMTVKILQMVNSAFFGLQRHIADAKEAAQYIGLDMVTSLTLALGVFAQFEEQPPAAAILTDVWAHSAQVGAIARWLAAQECPTLATDAFTAGLLHDIGEVVLAVNHPAQCDEVAQLTVREALSHSQAERMIFGVTHAEIGAFLLGLWGLPSSVIEAVAYHHAPGMVQTDSFTTLTAVHLADAIRRSRNQPEGIPPQLYDANYLTKLGLLEKLPHWHQHFADSQSAPAATR